MDPIETAITITDVAELLWKIFDSDGDGQVIPSELIDILVSFSNGKTGDNDIELLLNDIKTSLTADDNTAYMETISQRLDTIDERLNAEFIALNDCLSLIATCFLSFFAFKVITWFYNLLSR